ncbi:hypothetical protein [Leyella stercorea]|uniref:hypothetical protein n=1 Tax=Leyella stercorea TaxID=363265 RepID=UPI0026DA8B14|nr:hypothetical protein [Leyella stercorea]
MYYRRVWHPAIPTQPSTTEIKKQEGVRIAERKAAWVQQRGRRRGYSREEGGVGMAGCHTLLNKKRQNSNKFWRLTVCRKRA